MERTVWKFRVEEDMPTGAEIVHVGEQDGNIYVWAFVDPSAPLVASKLYVAGTGHVVPSGHRYVGTAMIPPFVWHVFERP